ncbi:hypothetical protein [Allorhizocola rhizosphaerae]|uniref:hypothetical protein n=1 Tax=Allorhizocola rhizosphaerae TaxID=1872709 RepID=UPI0013C36B69|nr:hypothetical protein [Allorhizocola rhizosphaerae]
MAHPPRVKLSTGPSGSVKAITIVVALVMLGIGVSVGLMAYGLAFGGREVIGSSLPDGKWHVDENGKLVPGPGAEGSSATLMSLAGAGALCALIVVLVAVYLALRVLRTGAWLEGSVLHMRGGLRTRKQDLATAGIEGGTHDVRSQRVEVMTVTDPKTGRRMTLPLRGSGLTLLPSEQLRMLANAITNHRVQTGPDDRAFAIAERLRGFANDPFS